jgi:sulfite exporter TauE/SafE/copper chaperone CopZ
MAVKTRRIHVDGMQCAGCEDIICDAIRVLPGIANVCSSYADQTVDVSFDSARVTLRQINQVIEGSGYNINPRKSRPLTLLKTLLAFAILFAIVGGVTFWGKSQMPAVMQMIKPQASYAILFGIGFLTGFHCIGMCGSFVVAYTDSGISRSRQLLSHLSYGVGKVISYTVLGAGFGLLGAAIAITPQIRAIAALAASLFLLIYGLKMLNVFAFLRRFTLRIPSSLNRQINDGIRKQRKPLRTGLMSGLLLGCGPLQAMYVMAAGSGDPVQGAMILLMFSVGTLLPLWGFGLFATLLSANASRYLVQVSGVLVIAMAAMMAQRGWQMLKTGQTMAMPHAIPHSKMMH